MSGVAKGNRWLILCASMVLTTIEKSAGRKRPGSLKNVRAEISGESRLQWTDLEDASLCAHE